MTFETLIDDFGTGFALDKLGELRSATVGLTVTKAQRKRLATEIESAAARGRVGRIANFMLIGLLTDQEHWLEWLKRSSVLRPSGYDLNTVTLRRLMPIVHRIADELAVPKEFQEFLDSLEWLIVLAEAAHKKRTDLLKVIAKDKLLVKSCLVTTDLLFMGRTFTGVNPKAPMSPEGAAAALSYVVYLVQKRSGPEGIHLACIIHEGITNGVLDGTRLPKTTSAARLIAAMCADEPDWHLTEAQ